MKKLLSRLKIKWVVMAAVVVLVIIAAVFSKSGGISAEVTVVSGGEIRQYIEETARVLSMQEQTVYTEGQGMVVDIKADVGDTIKQGELLLILDKADLELQLKNAEAGLDAAKAQLAGTELASYANRIELAKKALSQAKITYDSAERNYMNSKDLYESNALSKEELTAFQDAYKTASASLDTAKLQLEDVEKGAPDYVKKGYKAQLEQAVILRDTIIRNIQKQEVRAVIDGVVLERLINKNTPAMAYSPIFVIGDVKKLKLEADILADDANKIQVGNEVEISGKALGEGLLNGKVMKIAPSAVNVTSSLGINQRRVLVTVEILSQADMLKPGYNAEVKIITEVKKDVVIVPDTSVFDYQDKSAVFVVENEKTVIRIVKKGIESGDNIEITEGLKAGESILAKPDNTIREGMKVSK